MTNIALLGWVIFPLAFVIFVNIYDYQNNPKFKYTFNDFIFDAFFVLLGWFTVITFVAYAITYIVREYLGKNTTQNILNLKETKDEA